jgi:sugar O-acyltransferase (sialic acid O-acetyltransferase NeuD family)
MDNLIIIGNNTTAKTVYGYVTKYNLFNIIGFAIHKKFITDNTFCDLPVFAIEDLSFHMEKKKDYLFVAILWDNLNKIRKKVYEELKMTGYKFANIISPVAIVNGRIEGENCWISDLALIEFGANIQSNVVIKGFALIGANTFVDKHCFIGAKTTVGGASYIGEQSFVGLNALIFDQVIIGKKCIIGAGTIIKRSLPDFTLCKTNLDSVSTIQYSEIEIENKLLVNKNVR